MIKVIILGANGSMGKLIGKLVLSDSETEVIGAFDVSNIGTDFGGLAGIPGKNEIKIEDISNLESFIKNNKPDIAVDFSIAEATEKNCLLLAKNGVKCVIGTTGLSEGFLDEFESTIKENKAPAVISSNMATGVNIFFKIASILATYLDEWDIEIIEAHHHRKRDSPSGTALTTAKIISDTIGVSLNDVAKFGRDKGSNKRQVGAKKEIGVHAIRGGDIVGDHIVLYAGPGERIELKHQAHSRECFASGVLKAIKYLYEVDKEDAKIISTQEVLGLNK